MSPEEEQPAVAPGVDLARLHRTVSVIGEALDRRRRKIAAGVPVDPPPYCPCPECGDEVLPE